MHAESPPPVTWRRFRVIIAVFLVGLAPVVADDDGITLTVSTTAVPGEVRLDFSGKTPTYEVYRSTDPFLVPSKGTRIGETGNTIFVDTAPPAEDILFYVATSRPFVLRDLMPAAQDLAGYMETYRELQDLTPAGGFNLNPAQFLHQATRSLLALSSPDPFPPSTPPTVDPPADPYPEITLQDDFFDRTFSKAEYLALFRQIDQEFQSSGSYPESLVVNGTAAEVRFDQMVYWSAGLIRAWQMLGYLPEHWNRYVISSIDLVPWDVPAGYQEYTSALESKSNPFWWNGPRRYYTSASHQYNMLKRGREIYGNTRNAYRAGEKIYDWVMDQWQVVMGYSSGRTQFMWDRDGWELANHFIHTSGVPRDITSSLFRASGLPASVAGAAYFTNRGWINIDVHMPYGSNPLDNPFYYEDIPPPRTTCPTPPSSTISSCGPTRPSPGRRSPPPRARCAACTPTRGTFSTTARTGWWTGWASST